MGTSQRQRWEEGRGAGLIGGVGATLLQRQPGEEIASWRAWMVNFSMEGEDVQG